MSKVTFKGIGIQNLGPFRERQYLDLQVRAGRPVILVKALNGSGKTTLLTCLQVVLYGVKALGGRGSDYEQLIRGLHRKDADDVARIDLELRIDANGERDDIIVTREWRLVRNKLDERLIISRSGSLDYQLSEDWEEFIDTILPGELVQLFLFDGEKIEALANPRTLPDMLRRATEAFLGIGGIDSLAKDLVAVERRALLQAKLTSSDYEQARSELEGLDKQFAELHEGLEILRQTLASGQKLLDTAQDSYQRFSNEAQRSGLASFEKAAEIRASEQQARRDVDNAAAKVREVLSDPLLPLASLGSLWEEYKTLWDEESVTRASKTLLAEIGRRDRRILKTLEQTLSGKSLEAVQDVLASDTKRYRAATNRTLVLSNSPNPSSLESQIANATARHKEASEQLQQSKARLADLERKVAMIPSGEQLAGLLDQLKTKATAVSNAEARLTSLQQQVAERESLIVHVENRLRAARERMTKDFQGQALDSKAIAAGQRTHSVLALFKDKLLASKATWLSNMITEEFRGLMRKQRLVSRVLVDPQTYGVTIVDANGDQLPMERLSAGERQLLAVAVLSALIRERKGRFPVVVDTPLARLDRTHRKALIQRFFAKVSHQVMVLSTDEEVEGNVYDEMARHTSAAYSITFSDELRSSRVGPLFPTLEQVAA